MRVLVIEDDEPIRKGVVDLLLSEGHEGLQSGRADDGLEIAVRGDIDLVLLDLGLPDRDGLDLLEELRGIRPTLPVIILTARGEEDDRVRGLKLGADDYVVKPFSARELLARVEAVARRSAERPLDIDRVTIAQGHVDLARHEVRFDDGRVVDLSERELELFRYLAFHRGRAVSREELLTNVWRVDPRGVETRTIDMHIVRLREKLCDTSPESRQIKTVRGQGYMFSAEVGPSAASPSSASPSAGSQPPASDPAGDE